MKPSDTVRIRAEVMARQVGDEVVILDLASGTYFGLDSVGARMWQLIGDGKNIGDVRDALLAEYEVSPEELERDMERLLQELLARGLISRP